MSSSQPSPAAERRRTAVSSVAAAVYAPFGELRALWFQVTGFHCNLACTHCLVSSGPDNHALAYLRRDEVRDYLEQAERLGVKEVYFTGGEPFLHPEMVEILGDTLAVAPATVLTNGTAIDARLADRLSARSQASPYSLEIRISLDHVDPAVNDAIRGGGVLRRVARAVRLLNERGLLPILTATEIIADAPAMAAATGGGPVGEALYARFRRFLLEQGVEQPRVKVMPVFKAGRLSALADPHERVTADMLEGFDVDRLQCHSTRLVAADGIYACPILAGETVARQAPPGDLERAFRPAPLAHPSCHTCYATGMTCSNA